MGPSQLKPASIRKFLIVARQSSEGGHGMSAAECISRDQLDRALPFQVAVDLFDGQDTEGALRRLFCTNLDTGPGHKTAVVHELEKYIFCFANLRDANSFRSQFGGKLILASSFRTVGLGLPQRKTAVEDRTSPAV